MLDIIVMSDSRTVIQEGDTNYVLPYISAIYNNLNGNMFFIKARMLSDDKIGAPVRSASFRAVLTSLNDEKFVV